jgi:poly(glycerol-phosphate) alpha-glucosyltransferase
MPETALPEGRYLSCAFRVSLDAGGQTRALLLRNRILARAGARPDVLVLGAAPDHDARRQALLERGLLTDDIGLLNIYDHYRAHGWGDKQPIGRELADLAAHRVREEEDAAGAPWRITYRVPGERYATYDYLRPDGSPYLRIPAFGLASGSRGRGLIQQVDEHGRVVGEWRAVLRWFRRWIRELARGNPRTFLFIDSRHVVPHVVPIETKRIHVVYVMHNLHVAKPYRWDSDVNLAYRRVLARIDDMDAMVTLTERQRDDIAERRGRTTNLFVVPNPVDPAPEPAELPARDPHRVAILARLEPQKRLQDAIAAFERVAAAVPEARLDIFGEGSRREDLQAEIDRRRLGGHVTLRGFDPEARDALWSSSAFLMTSSFEGYPLSTLESMSRGCPVVSYDIKYGPREQITDGADGLLVPRGDVDGLAERVIELLRSPELVARLSAAARETARRNGPEQFLANWARVLAQVVELRPSRTRVEDVALETTQLRTVRGGRLQFAGLLRVRATSRRSGLDSARVQLSAVDPASGAVVELPLKAKAAGEEELRLQTRAGLRGGPAVPDGTWLRLRLLWQNSAWETELMRAPAPPPSGTARRGDATRRAPGSAPAARA